MTTWKTNAILFAIPTFLFGAVWLFGATLKEAGGAACIALMLEAGGVLMARLDSGTAGY